MKTIFIPERIKIDEIISQNPPQIENFKKEALLLIIGLISETSIPKTDNQSSTDFRRIFAYEFQSLIHDYKKYLNYLESAGIIKIDRQYIVGVKARGYAIADEYFSRLIIVEVKDNSPYKSDIYKNLTVHDLVRSRKRKHLSRWLDSKLLSINFENAVDYLNNEYEQICINDKNEAIKRYNRHLIKISRIYRGDIYYFVDSKGFRFHSNFTNLRSDLRNFLTFNDKNLISLDLKNSQPYLCILLLNKAFYMPGQLISISKLNLAVYSRREIESIKDSIYIILEEYQKFPRNLEVKNYVQIVVEGRFYEHFQQRYKEEYNEDIERKAMKVMLYSVFFGTHQIEKGKSAKIKRLFQKEFPTVYEIFGIFKKKGYNKLAILLQRIESFLIIDIICKKMSKIYPEMPLITIHDSIATTEDNADLLEIEMKTILFKYIGYLPQIKKECWTSNALNKEASDYLKIRNTIPVITAAII